MPSRKTYAQRTGLDTRANRIMVSAIYGAGPAFQQDDDGNLLRDWKKEDLLRWTYDELKSVISNRVCVTDSEMLGTVPPSAIKWSVNKGWLIPHGTGGAYFVTTKAAFDLNLPVRFKGIHGNRKIPFAAVPASTRKA